MRWWAFAASCFVVACSTDTFSGDDAGGTDGSGSEGGGEAGASDGGGKADAISPEGGAVEAGGSCLASGNITGCGTSGWCNSTTVCCASDNGAQCISTTGSCNGTVLGCRDTADCGDSGIVTCCLIGATVTADVCPRVISKGASACTANSCAGYKLCATGAECPGAKSCEKATGSGGGVTFGICL